MGYKRRFQPKATVDYRMLRLGDWLILDKEKNVTPRMFQIRGILTYDKNPECVYVKENNKYMWRLSSCSLPDFDTFDLPDFDLASSGIQQAD